MNGVDYDTLYLQINDLPDFLSGKDQEQSLHIHVVHTHAKGVGKRGSRDRTKPQSAVTPGQQYNYRHSHSAQGKTMGFVLLEAVCPIYKMFVDCHGSRT